MTPDTSAQEVGRLADALERGGLTIAATTLRALLAERDDFVRRETRDITNDLRDANDKLAAVEAERDAARAEVAELKSWVVAFGAPWAALHAMQMGWPRGHLDPGHYDILERCGARMASFTRAALAGEGRSND